MKNKLIILSIPIFIITCFSPQKKENNHSYKTILREECKFISHKIKPRWINNIPEQKKILYYVGLSHYLATEKEARASAYYDAIKNVSSYIGTEVMKESTTIQTTYGISSGIIDPAVVKKEVEKILTKANTRKVKAKEWSVEKCTHFYKKSSGVFYKVYVLAKVSKKTIQIEINRQKEEQKKLAKKVSDIEKKLKKALQMLNAADDISTSRPCHAYMKYSEAINKAKEAQLGVVSISSIISEDKINNRIERILEPAGKKKRKLEKDPEASFQCAILGLVSNYKAKPVKVAVAEVVYKDTKLFTSFSQYLSDKIERYLTSDNTLYQIISMKDLKKMLIRKKSSINACLSGRFCSRLNALLYVQYWDKEEDIEVKLALKEIKTKRLIDSETITLPKKIFPPDTIFKPPKRIGVIGFFDKGKRGVTPLVLLVNGVNKILSQAGLNIVSEDFEELYKPKRIKENDKDTLRFLRNKMNARFIGIIYCQPVSSGVFQKIHHSIISGFFTIVDTFTFKPVYSVSIENIKGYQLSPDKAEQAAINEFRKKLSSKIKTREVQRIIREQ